MKLWAQGGGTEETGVSRWVQITLCATVYAIFHTTALNSGNPHWFKRHSSLANPAHSGNPQSQLPAVQGLWKSKIVGYEELQKGRLLGPEEVPGSGPQYIPYIVAKSVFRS